MSLSLMRSWWAFRPCSHPLRARSQSRHRILGRLATPGQARIGHEIVMCAEFLLTWAGLGAGRGAVRQELPALLVVLEVGDHDLVEHLLVHGRVDDRAQNFDAAIQVARHHVGGRDVDRRLWMRQSVTGAETIDAAVFEEASDDRLDADIFGQSGHPGPQAADAAYFNVAGAA